MKQDHLTPLLDRRPGQTHSYRIKGTGRQCRLGLWLGRRNRADLGRARHCRGATRGRPRRTAAVAKKGLRMPLALAKSKFRPLADRFKPRKQRLQAATASARIDASDYPATERQIGSRALGVGGRHRRAARVFAPFASRRAPRLTWLAVLLLLFQTLLPLLHRPPYPTVDDAVPAWVLASLCRSGAAIDPSGQQAPAKKAPFCPICLSTQISGTFLPANGVAAPPPRDLDGIVLHNPPPVFIATIRDRVPSARAPPVIG